ncbi:Chromodomain-helicase-DNA-binding protein 7 [Halotydeus destructor]|nr:Chromodomain-helicase-DNA-binding protein 7 [Halotydeus destructor]
MDPNPVGMADYQLLGEGFGYHSSYAANASNANQSQTTGGPPGLPGPTGPSQSSSMMAQMMGPGGPGSQPGYHQMPPSHGGQRPGLSYGAPGADPKTLHGQYPGYGAQPSAIGVRGQYGPSYGDYGPGIGQSSLGLSHASGPAGSLPGQLSSPTAGYSSRLVSPYHDQRMRAPTPVHGLSGHPSYPGYAPGSQPGVSPYGHSGHSAGSDLWSSSPIGHMQRPPYGSYPGAPPHLSSHGPRSQAQFPGQSDYSAMHGTHRPGYYQGSSPANSSSSGIPSESSSLSPYSSQGSFGSQASQVSRSASASSRGQGQYGLGYSSSGPSSGLPPPTPSQPPAVGAASAPGLPRYPQQYPGYPQSQQSYSDTSAQSRLSPYGLSGPQPNSPNYRPPYPGVSQLTSMSPRRSTAPTPPAGSPMPPTSRTPDRVPSVSGSAGPVSQTQSSFPSPGTSQLTSPGQGVSPSASTASGPSSLQQLEQMVMPHLSNSSTGKPAVTSANTSTVSGPFFGQAAASASSQPSTQSQSEYSHFSQASPASHSIQQPTSQSGYYPSNTYQQQQQQQSSSAWSASQQNQAVTSTPSSVSNTHNSSSSQSSVPYSPASQQLGSTTPLRSPQQPVSAAHSSVTTTTAQVSTKNSMSGGRFQYESQFHSPSNTTDSFSAAKPSELSSGSSMINSMSPHHQQNIQKPSPMYDVTSGPGSFGSPGTPLSKLDDTQIDQSAKEGKSKDSDYQQDARKQSTDSSNFYGIRSSSNENSSISAPVTDMNKQETSLSQGPQASSSDQSYMSQSSQPSSFIQQGQPYMDQQQQQMYQSSYGSQQYGSSYSDNLNYDMGIGGEQMSSMNSYGSTQMSNYDPNYGQANMENMSAPHMGEYSGEMSDMGGMPPYASPYDDTFASEPPTKRKGKGRPKKDPNEPKKEKKPRQPRTPKSPRGRGRGRGASVNMGDRMPPPPQPPPDFGGYGLPPDHPSMYPPHHHPAPPGAGPPPGYPPMPHPHDPYQMPMMPPMQPPVQMPPQPPPQVQNHMMSPDPSRFEPMIPPPPTAPQLMTPSLPVPQAILPLSLPEPPQMIPAPPPPPPELKLQEEVPLQPNLQVPEPTPLPNFELPEASKEDPLPPEVETPSEPNDTRPSPSDEMFSQSTSSSTDQPLFTIPNSEDSSSQITTQPESTENSVAAVLPPPSVPELEEEEPPVVEEEPEEPPVEEDSVVENTTFDLGEPEEAPPEVPKKKEKKGKKRKQKEPKVPKVEDEEVTFEIPEKKPKKPKKERASKKKKVPDAEKEKVSLESSLPKEEEEETAALEGDQTVENPVFDEATQEEVLQESSTSESPTKAKKGKSKDSKQKKPKVKAASPKGGKKKFPKLGLKFKQKSNKKRKRLGESDNSDMEKTPPPSPENGDDGILKRRSGRNTKRTKYLDEVDMDLSADESKGKEGDQNIVVTNINEDTMVVEKIMAIRKGTRELELEEGDEPPVDGKPPTIEVDEFYVKYKNLSYLHCDWRTEEELERGDKRVAQKIKRFRQKKDQPNALDFLDDELFNPDYCEVDRILDVNIVEEWIPDDDPPPATEEAVEAKEEKESVAKEEEESEKQTESKSEEKMDVSEIKSDDETKSDLKPEEEKEKEAAEDSDDKSEEKMEVDGTKAEEETSDEGKTSEEIPADDLPTAEKPVESDVIEAEKEEEEKVEEEKPKKMKKRISRHYLVKWCALTYEESTWELEDDLDPKKLEHFWRFRKIPPKEKTRYKKRPKPTEWKKLDESPVYKSGRTLRPYQLEGVSWLTFCWYNGRNCILADEMGLGKTIQSLTFINEMVKFGIYAPFLIIVPLSTIGNWQREFETWTDLNVITYHGSSISRNMIQEYEMFYKNDKGERVDGLFKFQVLITTFEVVLTDCMELREITWRCCIIDEAHRLKNRNCKLLEGLRLLNMDHRVLLTGTPLQNNVDELFSLLNFLEPQQFASSEQFLLEFGDLKTEEQVDKLKALLKPMMLRRLKDDVEKSLAPKEETIVEVELTNIQKKYYRAILERNFTFLSKGGTYANMPNLMNTMMELRKCCIHPFLINSAEEQITHDYKYLHGDTLDSHLKCMVQSSGKLVLIDKLLPKLKAGGHRVLIFSQMVRCLDILEDYLVQMRYPFERIDGRVRGNLRQAAIDRFSKPDSDRFVFLLCTRAGGLGINLTAADTVIIFDSDWNPQNDLQAQARCHRIGQLKMVKIYRLICRNTYEREMFDKASLKLGLDKAVLQSMNTQQKVGSGNGGLSKEDVEELLRKGAYGAIMDDDNAGDKFCEEDIDQILQRRTQIITIESEEKGSTFSKATFASADNADIEIDDPNFWEKWAKKANIEAEEVSGLNELIVQEPRRRTQTKRFGQDDQLMEISEADSSGTEDENGVSGRTRGQKGKPGKLCKKGKKNRGGGYERERDEDYLEEFGPGNWARAECYKVEKGLLTFGWERWEECLILGNFRRKLGGQDVEDIARVILLYCLQNYKGDEKLKTLIWDLITPPNRSSVELQMLQNSQNMDAPSIRGKKSKKGKKTVAEELSTADWTKDENYNPEILLTDDQYRKHLGRHANKILLRVKMLYILRSEIISDLRDQVYSGVPARDISILPPVCDGEPPSPWWDEECDKSLLVGVFKHGYDRYNLMRQDPALCFLHRCGPPDGAALLAEINDDGLGKLEEDDETDTPATPATPAESTRDDEASDSNVSGRLKFPSRTEMNQRIRKLVVAYQKQFKKQEMNLAKQARNQQRLEKIERYEAAVRERELKKREQAQKKWSRREESDFYRTVSSYGVEYDRKTDLYDWTKFRSFSRLDKKLDETLTEYFKAFYAMCKRVTGRKFTEEEENLPISVDPISEERANRSLARIDLLSKVREEVLLHPELEDRLMLCQPSIELPDWWICGKHDKDLLLGAAKYGLNRLDFNLMQDEDLSFREVLKQAEEEEQKRAADLEIRMKETAKAEKEELTNGLPEEEEAGTKEAMVNGETDESDVETTVMSIIERLIDEIENESKEKDMSTSVKKRLRSSDVKPERESKPSVEVAELKLSESTAEDTAPEAPLSLIKPFRWPKDRVLQMRVEQICYCVEKNEWPSLRHSFFPSVPNVNSTPSVATADSSPRAVSPGSLSSVSREPTPLPTPEHTPRRDSISPSPSEYYFDQSAINDPNRRRRRRRKRFEVDAEKVKLRNLLTQTIDSQHHHQQVLPPKKSSGSSAQSLLSHASNFLPPLFNHLPFMNLRQDIRNELMNDEKTASMLLGGLSRAQIHAAAAKLAASAVAPTAASSSSSQSHSNGPPPAHQNSSSRRNNPVDTLDLRFKPTPTLVAPPAPAHKPPPKKSEKNRAHQASPLPVLDLSSGPNEIKRSTRSSGSTQEFQQAPPPPSGGRSKRIGSRIDALALNLQAKKMMEEKPEEPKGGSLLEQLSARSRHSKEMREMEKAFENKQNSKSLMTPPAAHSGSKSSNRGHSDMSKGLSSFGSADALSKMPQAKSTEANAILQQAAAIRQDLKKWLEEHPEFVSANPQLAAAAAMAFNPPPISSSIPANTELLELPEGRRRGRRPKTEQSTHESPNLTGDENVTVINRMTGKKITGSKAPPLKHLTEWLEKNPMFDVDSKWKPSIRENMSSFKTPTVPVSSHSSSGSIRTRTSDRRSDNSSSSSSSASGSRRTTAASLLAHGQSGHPSHTPTSSSAGFNFNAAGLNSLAGFNPSLLAGFPSMKMFMDMPTSGSSTASSSKSSASSSSSGTNSTNTTSSAHNNMFFPFGGLAGMGLTNPLFGFPGFNMPGMGGANPLAGLEEKKGKDGSSGEKSKSDKSGKGKNSNQNSMASLFGAGGLGSSGLPFMYPNPNMLYPGLGLGGFGGLPGSPFGSLAQSSLMNGLGIGTSGMSGFTNTTTTSSTGNKSRSSAKSSSRSSGAPSGLSLSTASSLLASAGVHPTSAAAAAAMGDSDDESLKSLMGHDDDDDDDLNGEMDQVHDRYDTDSDYEAVPKRKSKSKDLSRSKKSNSSSTSKSKS